MYLVKRVVVAHDATDISKHLEDAAANHSNREADEAFGKSDLD